jgi:REP element-mobilizing transposase RayT
MEEVGRRRPVHQDLHEGFNMPVVVFLIVCTKDKKPILANDEVHTRLRESWLVADSWIVGRYVLMPDHLHLFCSPVTPQSPLLQQWVSYSPRGIGQSRETRQSGSAIFGIPS